MRAYSATFAGAFFSALLYSTKPDSSSTVTLARSGDVAVVVDTGRTRGTAAVGAEVKPSDSPGASASSPAEVLPSATELASDLDALRAMRPVVPVAGVAEKDLVNSFEDRRGRERRHYALDIMAARNTPAVAAVAGTILRLHSSAAGGLTVYMTDRASRFILMYGHLDSYRPGLVEGASVARGEIIGFVGTTGNASPLAPHLHFQILRAENVKDWWKGTPLNPFLVYRP